MWGLDFEKAGKVISTDEELEQEILDNIDIIVNSNDYYGAPWYFTGHTWASKYGTRWEYCPNGTLSDSESFIEMHWHGNERTYPCLWLNGDGVYLEFYGKHS
jgi:hypothetical protein